MESVILKLDPSSRHGKHLVELGAGTGTVGLMAAYYGLSVINTDLQDLVPLLQHNIDMNKDLLKGNIQAKALKWGDSCSDLQAPVDYLILANCVYYDSSLEPLLQSMLDLSDAQTEVYGCYEVRTPEIGKLIDRWHTLVQEYFHITMLPDSIISNSKYKQDFVKLVHMKRNCKSVMANS